MARGSGTGLSGGALPVAEGVLIALSRMRRVLEVDLADRRVMVEPGVTNLDVPRALGPTHFFPPDPSGQVVCSIGGNVAENSGGAHCFTDDGPRNDVDVGLRYVSAWLGGDGAAAIHGLMEDAAAAEIARSQVWQWIRHGVVLPSGDVVTPELVRRIADEEGEQTELRDGARAIFDGAALDEGFPEFFTLSAYERLP